MELHQKKKVFLNEIKNNWLLIVFKSQLKMLLIFASTRSSLTKSLTISMKSFSTAEYNGVF